MERERERTPTVSLLDLLFWPVTLPVRSLRFILEQIAEAVASETDNRESVRQRMQELEARYQRGEIDEVSFQAAWDELAGRWESLAEAGDGAGVEAGTESQAPEGGAAITGKGCGE